MSNVGTAMLIAISSELKLEPSKNTPVSKVPS